MNLTKIEQETIILFNEAEQTAEIYTHNRKLKQRLSAIRDERPDDVTLVCDNDLSATYRCPKSWLKISPPRRLSDEQRQSMAQRLHKAV